MSEYKVLFFPNGNTVVFRNGKQAPELQADGWFRLTVSMFAALGLPITEMEFTMPDCRHARVFDTPDGGFNWSIE